MQTPCKSVLLAVAGSPEPSVVFQNSKNLFLKKPLRAFAPSHARSIYYFPMRYYYLRYGKQ